MSSIARMNLKYAPLLALVALTISVVAFAGCGGSSSSKPAFCANEAAFQQSVADFGNSLKSLNVSQIEAAGETVKSSGDAMISSARSSYPTETTALRSSIDQVQSGLSGLATSNDKPAAVASLVANLATLQTDYKALEDATSSDCG